MIDLPAFDHFIETVVPQEVARRGKRRSVGTAIAIGTLLILDDGSECVFAGYDQNGNILCYPPEQ